MAYRNRTAKQKKIHSGLAHDGKFRFLTRRNGHEIMTEAAFGSGRLNQHSRGRACDCAWNHLHGKGIVVKSDGAHRRAKPEKEIALRPSSRIGIVREVAIVADDIAVYFLQSF